MGSAEDSRLMVLMAQGGTHMDLAFGSTTLPLRNRRWWRTALTLVAAAILLFAITVADGFV
jgi:hypothetical protein